MTRGDVYRQTRTAWRDIWQRADLARELETRTYPRARALRARYLPYLPTDGLILEAGCGLGIEVIGLTRSGYRVVGLDYVAGVLGRVKRVDATLPLAAGDVHALPFADGTFAAYLSFGVLEHFEHGPRPALDEAARVLAPLGILVLTVPAPNLVTRLVQVKQRLTGRRAPLHGYYETTYDAEALTAHVTAAGFAIVECASIGHDFTLWGLGGPFRAEGYYRTTRLAEGAGAVCARLLPRAMAFATLVIARRPAAA